MFKEEPMPPPYKPFSKRSKFLKPNAQGQVPKDCVHFNFYGKHCWTGGEYEECACDCVVLKNEFCEIYKVSAKGTSKK